VSASANRRSSRASRARFALVAVVAVAIAGLAWLAWWLQAAPAPIESAPPSAVEPADAAPPAASAAVLPDERTVAAQATPSIAPATGRGTVLVDVYREPAVPVVGVHVLVGNVSAVTDESGRAVVTIGVGKWPVIVDERSLAKDLLPPVEQHRNEPGEHPPGWYARMAEVAADTTVNVRLRVFLATSVTGIVVDREGVPVRGCGVNLTSRAWRMPGVAANAVTDDAGVYWFRDVRPGDYQLSAWAGPDRVGPLPLRVAIAEGERGTMPTLVIDGGAGTVNGRVLDQDGAAVAGVPVELYPTEEAAPDGNRPFDLGSVICKTTTGADGTFVATRLPAGRLTVQVHGEGALQRKGEAVPLVSPPKPAFVDLRERSDASVEVAVVRSRPFDFVLTVIDDETKLPPVEPGRRRRPSDVYLATEAQLRDETTWQRMKRDDDGRYRWKCETPHEPVWIVVRGRDLPPSQRRVEPKPSSTEEIEIRYP